MPRSSPEKLAAALRANLRRRKQGPAAPAGATPQDPARPVENPPPDAAQNPTKIED